ncbi:hydroxysqualene dehydroxylase HpnE [Bacteroidota bacterium]
MKKVIIIGGGLAGLTAATYLVKAGFNVILLEASPKLGGRAYSIFDTRDNKSFDNGQHLLMGCYHDTFKFLNIIDSENELIKQKFLKVYFVAKGGKVHLLNAGHTMYPANLVLGLLKYTACNYKDRLKILDFFLDLLCTSEQDLKHLTVTEWLKSKNQNESIRNAFWDIISVGTLNCHPDLASASLFLKVLKEMFLNGNNSSVVLLPKSGLSQMYCTGSEKFITGSGGIIKKSSRVIKVEYDDNNIVKLFTPKEEFTDFDYLISAVPYYSFQTIFPKIHSELALEFTYSTILNVHLWLKNNPFEQKFYGLINSRIHWVFNNDSHITIVISSAGQFDKWDNKSIIEMVISELSEYFPVFFRDFLVSYKIVKEKRATFIPDIISTKKRSSILQSYNNLFICGDWINTGLPATIEGAVKSGRKITEELIKIEQ